MCDTKMEMLIEKNVELSSQVDKLMQMIITMSEKVENLEKSVKSEKPKYEKAKKEEDNNDLCIVISKYKKSLLISNMYSDKNTTVKCKEVLKELGAKWFKGQDSEQGWLFVGKAEEGKSLEENSKDILNHLGDFNVEVEYK